MKTILQLTVLFLVAACSSETPKENGPSTKRDIDSLTLSKKQLQGVNVRFTHFSKQNIQPIIHANGIIKPLPESKAEISSHIAGKVERIFVREGMKVSKGQPILSISSFELLELQNEYAAAKADAEFQKAEYERQETLTKKNMGVLAEFQNSKARYQAAVVKEKMLLHKLELIGIGKAVLNDPVKGQISPVFTITAPLDGYINKLQVHIGTLVESQTILAEIINPTLLQAEVYVYEKDAAWITEGLPVSMNLAGSPGLELQGKVSYINRALDPETKTITLHVNFEKRPLSEIHADMTIRAEIKGKTEAGNGWCVPLSTLFDDGSKTFLFVSNSISDSLVHMKRIQVKVQRRDEDYAMLEQHSSFKLDWEIADNNVLSLEAERKKNE
ncbi:hypothetical protein MASR2M44_10500 [Bacteroidota bacterium]